MSHWYRNGSNESLGMASRSSSDSGVSGENSAHNSNSSIPSSLTTTATNSTHSSTASPPPLSSPSSQGKSRTKQFSLNLNGHLTPPPPSSSSPSQVGVSIDSPDQSKRFLESGHQRGDRYVNKESLAHDLSSLATMPELCDVTFLVGEDRQPVCGVRAILAARSRIFRKMLYTDTIAVGVSKKLKKKPIYRPSDGYIEKYDFRGQPTVIVKDFEVEVFKLLIDYIHTGTVVLQTRTLLGLMNASDHYALEELKQVCIRFMEHCITTDTVCSLLSSAEKYIQYKSTKILVQKIFEYVDANAESILRLLSFQILPQHVVRIVLSREELKATEATKFEAAYKWCLSNIECNAEESEIKILFEPFLGVINYNKIPAKELMQKVKPSGVVDDSYILTALAYQADPNSILLPKKVPGTRINSASSRINSASTTPADDEVTKQIPLRFRRVQSSNNALEPFSNLHRSLSEDILPTRDDRAGSVPLDSDRRDGGSRPVDHDGFLFMRGSEVHPLRAHHIKERMDSQSSSHFSVLSTPPLSPMESPTTVSYEGSFLSSSSGDSVPVLSPSSMLNSPSGCHSQPSTPGGATGGAMGVGGANPKKRLSYNPQALDALVSLSSASNPVEV